MNVLTVDLEDIYDSLLSKNVAPNSYNVSKRVKQLLGVFAHNGIKATFFVVGAFALRNAELVYEISKHYDIGSHGYSHDLAGKMTAAEFEKDLQQSLKTLSDITKKDIVKYRSPGFSLCKREYIDILAKNGIETDCSLSAMKHSFGQKVLSSAVPCRLECKDNKIIKELPPCIVRFAGMDIGFNGGGYLRTLPYELIKRNMNANDYNLVYIHPYDFETNQPKTGNRTFVRRIKSRAGVKTMQKKLNKLIRDFEFTDVATAVEQIDWQKTKIISI
ncbi:MAG: polysaccharide deacetylase family protein [Bacteroidales bacterium]|nr:polysaccharide deacetylase family protein [Bacteroidales bacterium]